jgi:hypothetical protein
MKLFKRYKTVTQDRHTWQDAVALKFVKALHKVQSGFASFMNRKLNHLSVQKRRGVFIVFFLVTGSLSLYYIIKGIWADKAITNTVKIDKIHFPKYDNKINKESMVVTDKDYQSIVSFKQYMDSLYATEKGKHQYDSILQARPGLMDSAQVLEQLYLSQQKH